MLKTLTLENFTVFEQAEFEFSPGLNLLIGENGMGKTHVIKAAYSFAYILKEDKLPLQTMPTKQKNEARTAALPVEFLDKFNFVFNVSSISKLIRKGGDDFLKIGFNDFSLAYKRGSDFFDFDKPTGCEKSEPIFIPVKEILSIFQTFSLKEKYNLGFDDTYYDLAKFLRFPEPLNLAQNEKIVLSELESIIGGKVTFSGVRFSFESSVYKDLMEIEMIAEGYRKIALLAYLISRHAIYENTILFWDEPEGSLNPRLLKDLARAIMALCKNGIQVFIATHSLFLLRELEILHAQTEYQTVPTRFFNLSKQGDSVVVEQGDDPYSIGDIAALDESLAQSDRFMALD